MLRFVYTGSRQHLQENAAELIALADKYGIAELRSASEEVLLRGLCVETAVERMLLGHLHNSARLKAAAMEVVFKRWTEVRRQDEWKRLKEEWPRLALEVYETYDELFAADNETNEGEAPELI